MRLSEVNFIRKSWSKSFNNGIVYKRVGFQCICTTISRQYTELFYKLLPEQLNLEGQWEVATSEISYPSMYKNVTEGKFMFFDKKLSKSSEFYYLESSLYPSITDIVEAMNTLIQERHNHSENCVTVKVSRRTQKVEIYLANEGSGLAFFSTDLGHIFGQYMNHQTLSNLQLRPLLRNSFHSFHIELRDPSGEKIPFVSLGFTHLGLMFRKASNIHF